MAYVYIYIIGIYLACFKFHRRVPEQPSSVGTVKSQANHTVNLGGWPKFLVSEDDPGMLQV